MDDDLDDLLDEVESKFCKDSASKKHSKTKEQSVNVKQPQTSR